MTISYYLLFLATRQRDIASARQHDREGARAPVTRRQVSSSRRKRESRGAVCEKKTLYSPCGHKVDKGVRVKVRRKPGRRLLNNVILSGTLIKSGWVRVAQAYKMCKMDQTCLARTRGGASLDH
eukprot:1196135-Prorocentrum_minimum.AAC.4